MVTDLDIAKVKTWWIDHGIEITGMQGLLFGTFGFNIFGSLSNQNALLNYFAAICRIGAGLGAKWLVFGSPKNRDRAGLNNQDALEIGVAFFRRLGDIAHSYGLVICLEPNPSIYGANFMTNSFETAMVVKLTAHHAIMMQFDTGAVTINAESPACLLQDDVALIGHVHASELNLVPLGDGDCNHLEIGQLLEQYLPNRTICIEMLATKDEAHEVSIQRALEIATKYYRGKKG